MRTIEFREFKGMSRGRPLLWVLTHAVILSFALMGQAPLFAAESLKFSEALRLGETNWLQAEEAAEGVLYHKRREKETWRRRYLPSLTVTRQSSRGDLSSAEPEEVVEARMQYVLYAGGRFKAGHLAARHAGLADTLEQREARAALHLQIAERFFDMLSSRRRLESLRISLERSRREHQNMRRRKELGLRTELEVLQAKLLLEEEQFNLMAEQRNLEEQAQHLSHLLRKEVLPEVELIVDVLNDEAPQPQEYYRDSAVERHWGLKRLGTLLDQSREELAAQQGVGRPEIAFTTVLTDPKGEEVNTEVALSLVYRFGGHSTTLEREESRGKDANSSLTFQGGQWVSSSTVSDEEKSTTRLGVTLFDFSGAAYDQASREAGARIEYARMARQLVELRDARIREVAARYHALEKARARQSLEGLRVEKNRKELAAYRSSYEAGSVPFEDVVERQTALTTGQLAEISARGEVLQAWAALLNASGLPFLP